MRALLGLARLLRLVPHALHGVWTVRRHFPRLSPAERQVRIQAWSARLLRLLGVQLQASGSAQPAGMLLVANHVSWLDIAAIHAVLPQARFVSKADVKHWPLMGAVVAGAGTLFIERSSKRDALRVVHQTAEALQAGDCVAVFPEGTTGPGPALLPFHANLLQAAVATQAPLLPVVLRWHQPGERFSAAAAFVGEMTLLRSLWAIASARGLAVKVAVQAPVSTAGADRRSLAEALRLNLAQVLADS
jgi:1-acyl-sn-glycerol-3-phosphate acyltransferase